MVLLLNVGREWLRGSVGSSCRSCIQFLSTQNFEGFTGTARLNGTGTFITCFAKENVPYHVSLQVLYIVREEVLELTLVCCFVVHLVESDLPGHLMKLLENFLPGVSRDAIVSELLPVKPSGVKPVLLHGDLTDENILGSEVDGQSNDVVMSSLENATGEHQASDLSSFLKSTGCEKYISLLVEQEELTFESLSLVDEAHLKDLGIPLGPRLAILKGTQPTQSTTTHARIVDSEDDGSDGRFDNEEEWETSSSSSSNSSEEEDEGDFTTPAGLAAIEAKRKARFVGPHEWVPTSVIDFADAKTGDPLYDLVAVFFAALVSGILCCV